MEDVKNSDVDYNEYSESAAPTYDDPLQSSYHVWGMQQNTDVVFDFLMGERGFFWDKHKKQYKKFEGQEPNFNELGLKDLYNIIHSVVNRANVLADLKQSQINTIMFRTMITVVKNMTRNKKRWDLKEHSRDSIVENCKNQLLLFLSKTKDGQTARLFYGNEGMTETLKHDDSFDVANNGGNIR